MPQKAIKFFDKACTLACDGQCHKAWGMNSRPKVLVGDPNDEDDFAYLADHELGFAPADPGTYEGLDMEGKPAPRPELMNRWCARECERSEIVDAGEPFTLPDFDRRVYNRPSSRVRIEAGGKIDVSALAGAKP